MITLLTFLLILLLVVMVAIIVTIVAGSMAFVLTFGDVVLCGIIIWLIIKHFIRKK